MAKLQATVASGAAPTITGAITRQALRARTAGAGSKQRPSFADRLARGVAGIAADEPQRERQLLRVFLEVALVDEWGESLLLDPEFPQWVDRVQTELQSQPELRELAAAVCQMLAVQAKRN